MVMFWLFNLGTGKDVEFVGVGRFDAGLNFVIGGGSNHGGVIAGEFREWEIAFETVEFCFEFFGILAEGLISGNTTGNDERFCFRILFNGGSDFFKENIGDGLIERGGKISLGGFVE